MQMINVSFKGQKPVQLPRVQNYKPQHGASQRGQYKLHSIVEDRFSSTIEPQKDFLSQPRSRYDVDPDLWRVLDLCSDEELEELYHCLTATQPFAPLVKSIVLDKDPPAVQYRGRVSLMHRIDSTFRFLAADSITTMRGERASYYQTLLRLHSQLGLQCPRTLATHDLESEIFVHVLQHCRGYLQGMAGRDVEEVAAETVAYLGDGGAPAPNSHEARGPRWLQRITAPLQLGTRDLLPTLAKLGGALTVQAVQRQGLMQLARSVASNYRQYDNAIAMLAAAARKGGVSRAQRAATVAATRKLAAATARMSGLQGALSLLGPLSWAWLFTDLAMKSIGTDYARITQAVCMLAQFRLLRTYGWEPPSTPAKPPPRPQGRVVDIDGDDLEVYGL